MKPRDFILNLLNACSREDFQKDLLKYKERLTQLQHNDLKQSFSDIYTVLFDKLKWYDLKHFPHFITVPFLSKDGNIFLALAEMKSCRPLEDSILCNISAYNHLYREPSHPAARLLSKIYISKKTCYIEDITSIYQRRGLGSFLLKMLEDLMRLLNVEKIIGWLSPVDLKNRDIQVAFYLSNGFEVKFLDNTRENGWISKIIS